ncbi:MAG: universal stress protein [Proteobacteria bacterium]|nr:universal stress protein [Pseudomonadota bacterium]
MTENDPLFSPYPVGGLTLESRLVALPVFSGYAYPDGRVSPLMIEHYGRLAASGVGLVVVANAAVSADGVTSRHNLRIDADRYLPGLSRLAQAIKKHGAAACLQLNHAGRFAKTDRPLLPSALDGSNLAFDLGSLKAFMEFFPLEKRFGLTQDLVGRMSGWTRPMTDEECGRVIEDFGRAAERAARAGFDLIELHGASGYLLGQFLSAYTNQRTDRFGGDPAARAAFPLAVIQEIKGRVGPEFPIGFRLLLREWTPGGIELEEALDFADELAREGVAYVSATVATHNSLFSSQVMKLTARPGYLAEDCTALKARVNMPVIISGRIVARKPADKLLAQKAADLIGLGRPLVADIDWVRKSAAGEKVRACINCWACLKRVTLDQGLACVRWPGWIRERIDLEHAMLSRDFDRVLAVVAGDGDAAVFQTALARLVPPRPGMALRLVFLKSDNDQKLGPKEAEFLAGAQQMWRWRRLAGGEVDHVIRVVDDDFDEVVHHEAVAGEFDVILIGRNPEEPWRERLLYREQERAMGLIGPGRRQEHALVAVDLSEASLLMLRYLCHSWLIVPGLKVTFVHVLDGPEAEARDRWDKMRRILAWDEDFVLSLTPMEDDVAGTLLRAVERGEFGTIIMGKRGTSGIKRWLMGSVSSGVLGGLTDQTLILVD